MGSFSIGGLASGLDTKSIIQQMMQVDSRPKLQLEWKSQLWSARKAAWSDLNTRLLSLQTTANELMRPQTWDTGGAVGATSSDETKVTASGSTGTAAPGTYSIEVSQLAAAQQSASTGSLSAGSLLADEVLSITTGGTSVDVALLAGDDLAAIRDKVNATAGVGVTASIDASGALVLAGSRTGAASAFSISSSGTMATELVFAEQVAALDAAFTVDGASKTSATNTGITGVIDGIALSLIDATVGPVTITVSEPSQAWVDATKAKLKQFVEQYNSVIGFVHQKTQAESRAASPTTLAAYLQGPMARDMGFSQVGFDLRRLASEVVDGLPSGSNMLADIGIKSTFSIGGGAVNGTLTIDDAKLDAALRAGPQQVQQLLGAVGAGTGITSDDGLVRRISEQVSQLRAGGRVDTAMTGAGERIRNIQQAIDRADERLVRRQAYYERMFNAMESAMGRIQSQNNWLSGQFASLSGGGSK